MTHDDDWFPLDQDEHDAQVHAVLALLGGEGKRVLDLGAGGGRLARPLVEHGHSVLCIDRDEAALAACAAAGAQTRRADLLDPDADLSFPDAPADAALLLGGTLMEITDTVEALRVFQRVRVSVRPGGWLALDGSLLEVWDDVAEGRWVSGVSEDGAWQMIWAEGDAVIALRRGDGVDPDEWEIREEDRTLRLWSRGALALLCESAGWGAPETVDFRTLLRIERLAEPGEG